MPTLDIDQLRQDLVTCTRLLAWVEIIDYSGHASARVDDDHLLIQPRDVSRAGITTDELLVVDMEGNVVEGDASNPPPAEVALHIGVYRNRPEAQAVCHGHPTLSTSFSMTDQPLLPMRHFAWKHPNGLPVHPDVGHIYDLKQGDEVAETLAGGDACLLRGHGTVVLSDSIQRLFMDCLDLEENARTLLAAQQAGGDLKPLSPEECKAIGESYSKTSHRPMKLWNHYIGKGKAAGVL